MINVNKKIIPKTPLIDPVYDQLMVNECHEHRVAWELLDLISICVCVACNRNTSANLLSLTIGALIIESIYMI